MNLQPSDSKSSAHRFSVRWPLVLPVVFLLVLVMIVARLWGAYAPIPKVEELPKVEHLVVFFARVSKTPIGGEYGFYLIDVDSGKVWQWLEGVEGQGGLSWSHQRQQLLFTGAVENEYGIYVASSRGYIQPKPLFQSGIPHAAAWSPDGNQIVFPHDDNLFLQNVDGTDLRQLTSTPTIDGSPNWSPDGTKIVFHSFDERGRSYTVYSINIDGSSLTILAEKASSPKWAPNGSEIAFVKMEPDRPGALALMNPDGSNLQIILPAQESDKPGKGVGNLAWSPDGEHLIFSSGKDGFCWFDAGFVEYCEQRLYLINRDGTGLIKLNNRRLSQTRVDWIR